MGDKRSRNALSERSTRALPHPRSTRGRDTQRGFHADPATNVLPPRVPVGGRKATPSAFSHACQEQAVGSLPRKDVGSFRRPRFFSKKQISRLLCCRWNRFRTKARRSAEIARVSVRSLDRRQPGASEGGIHTLGRPPARKPACARPFQKERFPSAAWLRCRIYR
jgi:hypothetical protein